MAFLDRLVSDLVQKSTGFNARPFVRSIGGKNILLLGGAAIAGAIAAEKYRAGQQQGEPSSAPPPPPPIPGAVPPPPPPIPQSAAPVEAEPPQALVYAIVRTMVAGALADGEMHAEEKKVIESRLGESGLSEEQVRRIQKDMVLPPPPAELASLVQDPEEREMLYRFGALVVLADEGVSDLEKAWLEKLGAALNIGEERRQSLEREIFSAS